MNYRMACRDIVDSWWVGMDSCTVATDLVEDLCFVSLGGPFGGLRRTAGGVYGVRIRFTRRTVWIY